MFPLLGISHAPNTLAILRVITAHSCTPALRLTCPLLHRQEEVAAAPPAICRRELFHGPVEATTENSTPPIPFPGGLRGTAAAGGHPIGHVRADGARHGGAVRVEGGAGGQAQGLAGELARGRWATPRPRQVLLRRRRRLLPRQVRVRAGDRRRCRLRGVVPGRARIVGVHDCSCAPFGVPKLGFGRQLLAVD